MRLVSVQKGKRILYRGLGYKAGFGTILGLMFSWSKKGIIMDLGRECQALIHTLFMFYSIDVAWLDSNFKVVDIKYNIRPFLLNIKPQEKARYVIELPAGELKGIKINEVLTVNFK